MDNKLSELLNIVLPIIILGFLGVFGIWASRWSRKKRIDYLKNEAPKTYRTDNAEDQTIIEQIKSKETWKKVLDVFFIDGGPQSNKEKAIRYDSFRYFGWLPLTIASLIFIFIVISMFLLSKSFQ